MIFCFDIGELKSKNRNALIVQVPPNAIVNIDVCLVSFTTTSVEKLRARLPLSCTVRPEKKQDPTAVYFPFLFRLLFVFLM